MTVMASARLAEAMKLILKTNSFGGFFQNRLKLVSENKGKVCFELPVEENMQNFKGTLHGGVSSSLVDIVSTMALASTGEIPNYGVSVDMNITFLAASPVGSTVLIESRALKVGRKMAFLTVDIKDKATGKLIVQGRHTKYFG